MPARPILIIHNANDPMFPPRHAQEMFEAAQPPKELWLVEGAGHVNPIHGHKAEYKERILGFFRNAFAD
jgi:fermentation-respiration switch protein FrsA (DUF1100 family)